MALCMTEEICSHVMSGEPSEYESEETEAKAQTICPVSNSQAARMLEKCLTWLEVQREANQYSVCTLRELSCTCCQERRTIRQAIMTECYIVTHSACTETDVWMDGEIYTHMYAFKHDSHTHTPYTAHPQSLLVTVYMTGLSGAFKIWLSFVDQFRLWKNLQPWNVCMGIYSWSGPALVVM